MSTPDQLETFSDLQVDSSTTTLIKAGSVNASGDYLIPFRDHPWHRGGTHANCVCVNLPDGRRLVVPCLELIRFYFGSTSDLLARLFTPPVKQEHLFESKDWDLKFQRLTLQLAKGIRGASAVDVARIATSEAAWNAARSISVSCARASAIGEDAYPAMPFPFQGATDLVASGKWLSLGDKPNQTFLVYSLRSCSYPFRFQKLRYKLAPDTSKSSAGRARTQDHNAAKPKRVPAVPSEGVLLKEEDASRALAERTSYVDDRNRFRDLERKSVWASRTFGATAIPPTGTQPGGSAGAVGKAVGIGHARAISLEAARKAGAPPDFMTELIAMLQEIPHAAISLLTASDQDGWTIEHRADGSDRPCRFAVFLIDRPTAQAKLIAIEDDPLTVLLSPSLPATSQRSVEDAIESVVSHLSHASRSPDLAIDLGEPEVWSTQAGDWIQRHLIDCVFPAYRD